MRTDPKYRIIADQLQKRIIWGFYSDQNPFPSESKLQTEFKVGRVTIRKAIQLLENAGVLRTHQGRRTQIIGINSLNRFENIKSCRDIHANCPQTPRLISYRVETVHRINPDDAYFLQTTAYESIYCLHRIFGLDGTPLMYFKNYIPYHIAPNFDQVIKQKYNAVEVLDLYSVLLREYGIYYTESTESIFASTADDEQASSLSVPEGTALVCSRREASCQLGPMECSYKADIAQDYRLILTMTRDYI